MTCIYEVHYEVQWHSSEPTLWEGDTVRVSSSEDALEAVEKAKKHALARHRFDENGREEHATTFRLRDVRLIAQADF